MVACGPFFDTCPTSAQGTGVNKALILVEHVHFRGYKP